MSKNMIRNINKTNVLLATACTLTALIFVGSSILYLTAYTFIALIFFASSTVGSLLAIAIALKIGISLFERHAAAIPTIALKKAYESALSPLGEVPTALGTAYESVRNACNDGRALDLVKRDIVSPLGEVPTAFTNTVCSLGGKIKAVVEEELMTKVKQYSAAVSYVTTAFTELVELSAIGKGMCHTHRYF